MTRLRVMFVLDSLGPGGTERSTAELLGPLRARGIDSELVCLRHASDGDEARVVRDGFPVHVLAAGSLARRVGELRARIRRIRPDVVHTAVYQADLVGRLAGWGTGVPVVSSLISTPYDPERRGDPRIDGWKLDLARLIDGFTARHCTARLHAVSEGTANANCRHLRIDRRHVTVVERGRSPDAFAPADDASRAAARARIGLPAEDRVVLAVGRHAYQKAFPDLVCAAGLLLRDVPSARVLIAGPTGPGTPELEASHRALPAPVRERVEILGYRTDVADLLHASDVFVMSSRWEGTAGAVLEAMACGVPVVATRVEGLEGVVTHERDGVLVPVGDSRALAAALARVLADDTLARSLGAEGRRTFLERFGLGRSADRMAALYHEIVVEGPRRAFR